MKKNSAILIITLFLSQIINYFLSFTENVSKKESAVIFMLIFLCVKDIYESM